MKSRILCSVGISAVLLTGCGSSGGDDGGMVVATPDVPPTIEPPTILPTYNYAIGGLDQGPDIFVDIGGRLEVAVDFGNTLLGIALLAPNDSPR